jgi:4a-hydroxytetrahydrobiopterin dehydratase
MTPRRWDHGAMTEKLTNQDVLAAIDSGLGDWRKLAQPLAARYRVAGPAEGAVFATAVARAAEAAGREPEIRLGGGHVDVALCTVDGTGGRWITTADLELARAVSGLAREHGLTAVPAQVTQLELALDTAGAASVGPFWSALLTGDPGNTVSDGSVIDPANRVPPVWFQETGTHELPRQRWHLDVWLAPEIADERIAAALAAGGTVVDDSEAPSFTVLADPDGNRACVCTALARR